VRKSDGEDRAGITIANSRKKKKEHEAMKEGKKGKYSFFTGPGERWKKYRTRSGVMGR